MTRIGVTGLGYAGLPLAVAFADEGFAVTGYDIDEKKVAALRNGNHPVDNGANYRETDITFTTDPELLSECAVIFVAVPTPTTANDEPDMSALRDAGRTIGRHLSKDAMIVVQSTVYPGGTRAELVPAVEATSGFTAGSEFAVGYAPERMNPGDETHSFRSVSKVVAAQDDASRERLVDLFETVSDAPVYPVSSIEACEATKCLENVQRDVNIALINEFTMACDGVADVDPYEVLDAAETKWNFHSYRPGLVNGHCIPVDPYHLVYRFEQAGYSPALMKTARALNDRVGTYVADILCDALAERPRAVNSIPDGGGATAPDGGDVTAPDGGDATVPGGGGVDPPADESRQRVLVAGLTHKPNVADTRAPTTKIAIAELQERGLEVVGYDPHATPADAQAAFGIPVQEEFRPDGFDALVVFTAHEKLRNLDLEWLAGEMNTRPVLVDTTRVLDEETAREHDFIYRGL